MPVLVVTKPGVTSPAGAPPPRVEGAKGPAARGIGTGVGAPRRIRAAELEAFTRNLETQVDAGVPLARALLVQSEHADSPASAALAAGLLSHLNAGMGLADALDQYPRVFSSVYRNLVRAGEHSGRLPRMLAELAEFLVWREEVRKTVRRAAVYPLVVLTATVGLLLLIVGYVLPKFGDLFARLGDATPLAARVLLAMGAFLSAHWTELIVAAAVLAAVTAVLLRGAVVRSRVYLAAACLPVVGGVLRAIDLARLTRTLAILTAAGIPLIRALELSKEAVGDARTLAKLGELASAVVGGQTLSQAAAGCGVFPGVALSLIAVGEESGQMPTILERLAKRFDAQARDTVQRALAMLEPAFTLFLGIVVGGLALVVITTLYKTIMVAGK